MSVEVYNPASMVAARSRPRSRRPSFRFVDLCAGIGGFHVGLRGSGGVCVGAADTDKWARRVYADRFPEVPLWDSVAAFAAASPPAFDVLTAGFPCQSFSRAGARGGLADPRAGVLGDLLDVIVACRPRAVLLENVPEFLYADGGRARDFLVGSLRAAGYRVSWEILSAVDFDVPQVRRRVFFVATLGRGFEWWDVRRSPRRALADVLEGGAYEWLPPDAFRLFVRPRHQPGGTLWVGYLLSSHTRGLMGSYKLGVRHYHRGSDIIISDIAASPTVVSQYTDRVGWVLVGGERVRQFSVPECFKLQGFPRDWARAVSKTQARRLVGNAVVPAVVSAIGRPLAELLG